MYVSAHLESLKDRLKTAFQAYRKAHKTEAYESDLAITRAEQEGRYDHAIALIQQLLRNPDLSEKNAKKYRTRLEENKLALFFKNNPADVERASKQDIVLGTGAFTAPEIFY